MKFLVEFLLDDQLIYPISLLGMRAYFGPIPKLSIQPLHIPYHSLAPCNKSKKFPLALFGGACKCHCWRHCILDHENLFTLLQTSVLASRAAVLIRMLRNLTNWQRDTESKHTAGLKCRHSLEGLSQMQYKKAWQYWGFGNIINLLRNLEHPVFSLRIAKHKWKELETIFDSRICKKNLNLFEAHSKNAQNLTSLLEADLQYTLTLIWKRSAVEITWRECRKAFKNLEEGTHESQYKLLMFWKGDLVI